MPAPQKLRIIEEKCSVSFTGIYMYFSIITSSNI